MLLSSSLDALPLVFVQSLSLDPSSKNWMGTEPDGLIQDEFQLLFPQRVGTLFGVLIFDDRSRKNDTNDKTTTFMNRTTYYYRSESIEKDTLIYSNKLQTLQQV